MSKFFPKRVIGSINKIWRNHFPGEVASFECAPRDKDGHFFKETKGEGKTKTTIEKRLLGDDIVDASLNAPSTNKLRGMFTPFTAEQSIPKYLGPKAAEDYFSKEDIERAVKVASANEDLKEVLARVVAGEAQRAEFGLVEQPRVMLTASQESPRIQARK